MFYKVTEKNGLDFRTKKYKKGEFVELEIGLANKLILNETVAKCDQDEAKKAIAEAKKPVTKKGK